MKRQNLGAVLKGQRRSFFIIFLFFPFLVLAQVRPGAEDTAAYFPLLKGKRVGIVANNASVSEGMNTVDFLLARGIRVKRIFSPEHGFRSESEAGREFGDSRDPVTGLRIVSLYGSRKKPALADLKGLDIMVFDIQDVGVRFYTYLSTLAYVMEACAEKQIPLLVLDRPDPNGFYIDGPVLEKEYASFVGLHPVPVVYGMTIGEYACMVNGESWLKNGVRCDLTVIPVANYNHGTPYDLPVKPSPNLASRDAIFLYPSLCFFEGTIMSVGRGTPYPFEVLGHPDMTSGTFSFTPRSIPGASLHPPFEGRECRGKDLRGVLRDNPALRGKINLSWLIETWRDMGHDTTFFNGYFNRLAGNATLKQQIIRGLTEDEIRESWKPGLEAFTKIRGKYLLYK